MRILILGGSGTAGRAIVSSLATSENELVVYDLNPEKVIFPKDFHRGSIFFLDVRDTDSFDNLFFSAAPVFSEFDALIYNIAATTELLTLQDASPEEMKFEKAVDFNPEIWNLMFDINVSPVFRFISKMYYYMDENQGLGKTIRLNKIIVTSSIYGRAIPDFNLYRGSQYISFPGYGASKAALEYLVRWAASFFGPLGLRINAISLGGVFNEHDDRFEQIYGTRVCLSRMARPTDIQGIYPFLLSSHADFITGQVIRVDGGYLP